jgi:hypothetical protein
MDENDIVMDRSRLIEEGQRSVNAMIKGDKEVPINIDAALNDLEDLGLVAHTSDGEGLVNRAQDEHTVVRTLKEVWNNIFDCRLHIYKLVGRRRRVRER